MDYNEALAITRDIYWIGFYDQEANLHCNPYLLIDDQEAVIFDPGSIPHFKIVMRKVIDLVNPGIIRVVVASHQDPDLCGNLAVVEDVIENQELRIAAHKNSIRLIRHYGIRSPFYDVGENNYSLTLKSGRVLQFIPVPFLHAPGAIVTYDPASKSLFSGDLFGAITENWSLFGKAEVIEPLKKFHQIYMPSNRILRRGLERLRGLDIERILPQHGSVLEGEWVKKAFEVLETLPCGLDLEDE